MDAGEWIRVRTVHCRFEIVRLLLTDFMNAGHSYAVSAEDMLKITLPPWARPGPPKEIGEDVLRILRNVADETLSAKDQVMARDIISGKRTRNTKYVMHRDNASAELDN